MVFFYFLPLADELDLTEVFEWSLKFILLLHDLKIPLNSESDSDSESLLVASTAAFVSFIGRLFNYLARDFTVAVGRATF